MSEEEKEKTWDRAIYERAMAAIEAAKTVASAPEKAKNWQIMSPIEEVYVHVCGYSEPGYQAPESGLVAVANWNSVTRFNKETQQIDTLDNTMGRLSIIFEKLGIELEWCDEWIECQECWGLVRTSPDSYGWSPAYVVFDSSTVCLNCLDPVDYLESIEENEETLNQIFEPSEHGYVHVEDFEHGFHPGQDASPPKIAEIVKEAGFSRWLFNLESRGQFDLRFSVYIHEDESKDGGLERLQEALDGGSTDGPSVSGAMKRGLEQASRQEKELRAQGATGIISSSVGMDGASTKEISAIDFIDGKALD